MEGGDWKRAPNDNEFPPKQLGAWNQHIGSQHITPHKQKGIILWCIDLLLVASAGELEVTFPCQVCIGGERQVIS